MYLSFATGLDKYFGLLDIMKEMGVVIANGATYTDWNGEKLGFYKSWRKDQSVWDKLLPELESRLKQEWSYGNKVGEIPPDEIEEDEDEILED
jgi:hypothetical protein